jgi:hypothetical protein
MLIFGVFILRGDFFFDDLKNQHFSAFCSVNSVKKVKHKAPDQSFREMSHLKAHKIC